ncbi:hypothetical protein A1O3_05355 [Capronia epimyces CBS 606.96]|uniref:Adenosinetriphosphatase n=1 Tax=Capronia epimyces CBS 606.96 TaxID=1182542 RepID=W9Y4V8_9EURO|nr:uncharacterized protein A1O3_05355 [Capronia epimyces CBS 606.96]EXJ84685.1 hypothetical protein A1O3_05355 [Capronia epimyces CBS 606.96]
MEPDAFPDCFNEPVYSGGHNKRQKLGTSDHDSLTGLYNDASGASSAMPYDPFGDDIPWNNDPTDYFFSAAPNWTSTAWETQSGTQTMLPVPSIYASESFPIDLGAPISSDEGHNDFSFLDDQSGEHQAGPQETDQINHDTPFPSESLDCYGMLTKIPILSHRTGLSTVASSSLDLHFEPPNSLVLSSAGREFGCLEERTAEILATLAAQSRITFQMYGYATKRRANTKPAKGTKSGQNDLQYLLNTIIYGPREFGQGVGDYLVKCKMFLQDPLQCDRDVPYLNPHLLSRSEEVVMTSSLKVPASESLATQEVVAVDVTSDLFSQNCDDSHLQLTDPPDLLRTGLYKHQKKALTFMNQREQAWSFEDSPDSLWVKEVDDMGNLIYTNLVTEQSQRYEPSESRGGLLADQMGLGKTLTMISLIALNPAQLTSSLVFTAHGTIRRVKSTLIVVPFSLLDTWDTQLERHLKPNTLSWFAFHGSQKRKLLSLGGYDIVITTYETLMGQLKKHNDPKRTGSTLFYFAWHRIVLDEAHVIRNRSTAIAQACCALRASRRWAMTGTPIQNKPNDLGSLLEFLHLEPFRDPKIFETTVVKPWLKSADKDTSRLKKLIRYLSLCRTKAIIDLPHRKDMIKYVDLGPDEADLYESAKNRTVQKLDEALSVNPITPGVYLNALEWLNELRLICNHGLMHSKREAHKTPTVVSSDGPWNKSMAKKAFATLVDAGSAICKLCDANLAAGAGEADSFEHSKPSLSKCLTVVCGLCIQNRLNGEKVPGCGCHPVCPKAEVSWAPESSNKSLEARLPSIEEGKVSTKLKTLLKDLQQYEKAEKSVVFSFWTYTLDLIESLLRQRGTIPYARIDGSLSRTRREQEIQRFQTDDSVRVILVSIICGGTGLDLTAASRAYLLEPQWNPMIEEQALSRIHRLGQTKEVNTIRYRVRGSFEEKVAMVQDMKRDIAAGAFSSDSYVGVVNKSSQLQEFRDAFGRPGE